MRRPGRKPRHAPAFPGPLGFPGSASAVHPSRLPPPLAGREGRGARIRAGPRLPCRPILDRGARSRPLPATSSHSARMRPLPVPRRPPREGSDGDEAGRESRDGIHGFFAPRGFVPAAAGPRQPPGRRTDGPDAACREGGAGSGRWEKGRAGSFAGRFWRVPKARPERSRARSRHGADRDRGDWDWGFRSDGGSIDDEYGNIAPG